MILPRLFRSLPLLALVAMGLVGCEDTPTSTGTAPADTAKSATKHGPVALLAAVARTSSPSEFLLTGKVEASGSVSIAFRVTQNGGDSSGNFTLPPHQIVGAPFDLTSLVIAAKRSAQPGEYLLTLTATDSLGNVTRVSCPLSLQAKAPVDPPVISGFGFSNHSAMGLSNITIKGTTTFGTDKATVSYRVTGMDTSKVMVPASYTVMSSPAALSGTIVLNDAPSGTYTITVTVRDNDDNGTSMSATFLVMSSDLPFERLQPDFKLGAQASIDPSFLDVDGAKSYGGGIRTASETASIDLVFFATSDGTPTLMSPSFAGSSALGPVAAWSTQLSTVIVDAGTTPVTTFLQAKSAIGTRTSQSAEAVVGHSYALKLSNGEYAAFTLTSLTGSSRSASATIALFLE